MKRFLSFTLLAALLLALTACAVNDAEPAELVPAPE